MTTHEACSIVLRRFTFESEVSCQCIVTDEAHAVACCVSNRGISEQQKKAIDAIKDKRAERTCYAKAIFLSYAASSDRSVNQVFD